MTFELFSRVALKNDVQQLRLCKGDVATIVEIHEAGPGKEPGYTLEVFNAVGETIGVVTVRESQIQHLTEDEVLHVRRFDDLAA